MRNPTRNPCFRHATFSVEGIQDQIGIRIIEGKEREAIFKAQFRYRKPPFPPMVFIQSKQRFPADTKVSLVWGKGVMSKTGVATDKDQVLRFKTRKPFLAGVLLREGKSKGRLHSHHTHEPPFLRTHFEGSGRQDRLERTRTGRSGGPILRGGERGKVCESISLLRGLSRRVRILPLRFPAGLKDDAGRPLANADQFPLSVRTDRYPPLAKFSARFGILELKADPCSPGHFEKHRAPGEGKGFEGG